MIYQLNKTFPEIQAAAFIAESASVIGSVALGQLSSIWFGAVLRGDSAPIRIGDGTNIQDNAVLHVDEDAALNVGARVTVGHSAILHACTVEDEVLIGMGAIVLNGAVIQRHTLVGAGALVPPGKTYPPGSLLVGAPAKLVRVCTPEEILTILDSAEDYSKKAAQFAKGLSPV